MTEPTPPPETPTGRAQRVRRILDECISRRARGQTWPDAEILAAHPDLAADLEPELLKLAQIQRARRPNDEAAITTRTLRGTAPASAPDPAAIPPQVEGYEILRELGHGGMGIVYQARDTRLNRLVAIKTLLGGFQAEGRLELLRREAQLAARLRHQNIVAIHALVETSDPPCVVMEWVDGVPIHIAAGRGDFREAAALLAKVARAVAYAHEMGVIHRDLKPGNILVDRTGEPRLLDFGLARAHVAAGATSSAAEIKGTPLFMAPEQFAAPVEVGPAADIYALGLVLHVLLTGAAPPAPGLTATPAEWARREPPVPRRLNPDVPEALQRICLKACETRAEDRYATAGHLADDLERFLAGRPVQARPTRYARLLAERVRTHVEALAEWEAERLITRREADALQDQYVKLLRTESLWVPGARRLRAGMVFIQVGGWFVVLAAILWAVFYWSRLGGAQRVLSFGVPTLIVNGAAFLLWRRSSQLVALLFTVFGALLAPLFALALLSESGLLATRAAARYELLPQEYFSNRQLAAAFWLAAGYAAGLLWHKRYALLSAALCVLLLFAAAGTLLLAGLNDWLAQQWFAATAAAFGPVPLLAYLTARRLDRPAQEQLAVPFYAVAGVGFLAVCGVLAYDMPKSWWNLPARAESGVNPLWMARELLLLGCGLIFLVLAWLHDRADTRLRRLWGALYFRIVPPCLIVAVDLLSEHPLWSLGPLGGAELRLFELAVPVVCILLIALGTGLQLRWFTYYSLLHLAIFLMRTTHRHFQEYLRWPIIIIVIGALAILVGLWLEHRRPDAQETAPS